MATFIKVHTGLPRRPYRLNVDQIVSYVVDEAQTRGTNITLATGGAITADITPEALDRLIELAGSHVVEPD